MAWRQQDYILRMIEQVSTAIRRALALGESGQPEGGVDALRAATGELLGPAGQFVHHVDTQTALNIVGDPQRLAMWARLLAAESTLLRSMGDSEGAEFARSRALEVARGAAARDAGARERIQDLLAELED